MGIDGEFIAEGDKCEYGLGNERTLEDYEKYAGVLFEKRQLQQYTLDNKYPPNPTYTTEQEYNSSFLNFFKHCIDIGYDLVPLDDYTCWAVAFEDVDGNEIYREDALPDEINRMKNDTDNYCKLWRQFNTDVPPYKWIVWPHSKSQGWMDRLEGIINPRLLEEAEMDNKVQLAENNSIEFTRCN